jgi:hypothetical protein
MYVFSFNFERTLNQKIDANNRDSCRNNTFAQELIE